MEVRSGGHAPGSAGGAGSRGAPRSPTACSAAAAHRRCARRAYRPEQRLANEIEPILSEEHRVADEEGRRAEHAARNRFLGVGDELGLHLGIGDERSERRRIEAGGGERRGEHVGIAEVLRCLPHRTLDHLEVALELVGPAQLHPGGAAHQRQRVDREVRVEAQRHAVARRPALQVFVHPAALCRHRHRARVAGRLEHAAEQHRPPVDRRPLSRRRSSATASTRGTTSGCRRRRRTRPFALRSCSPRLQPRPQVELVGPRTPVLAVQAPVVVGDRVGAEDAPAAPSARSARGSSRR